jgi:hypothetical protein
MVTLSDNKEIYESRTYLADNDVFYSFDANPFREIAATIYRDPAWPDTEMPWRKYLSVYDALDAWAEITGDMDLAECVAWVSEAGE